jgi:GrpB-like predicted nucleotidyltransferase (UPF0157 family)
VRQADIKDTKLKIVTWRLHLPDKNLAVEIVNYKESWPSEFQTIAATLHEGLGDLALRIDHIGSTSVPGLAAKDIIDVQIAVADLSGEVVAALTALGYTQSQGLRSDHRPPHSPVTPESEWQKFFFRPPAGQRRTNLHVRVLGRANQRYPILFRDYLRSHPATGEAYTELKRRLAAGLADPETYPDVKDPAVDLIAIAAEDWATATHWQMGTADA